MDKITKLSDAIRLGATFREQCFGLFFEDQKSCAIGAALEALGLKENEYDALCERFPVMHERIQVPLELLKDRNYCLYSGAYPPIQLSSIIWRLNDHLKWSRERIADWLAEQGH